MVIIAALLLTKIKVMVIIAAFFLTKIKVMVIIAAFFLTKIKVMVIIAAFFLTTIIVFLMIKFVMKICAIYKRFTMWNRIKRVYFNHLLFLFSSYFIH
ncbi:hypothetical protein, partial [Peribacillus frigoritolerans]|uniref:hypothetical protein n=1 Tax=Peribacillus castrilensis TaxID=2897690 RepID=UPI003DA399DA